MPGRTIRPCGGTPGRPQPMILRSAPRGAGEDRYRARARPDAVQFARQQRPMRERAVLQADDLELEARAWRRSRRSPTIHTEAGVALGLLMTPRFQGFRSLGRGAGGALHRQNAGKAGFHPVCRNDRRLAPKSARAHRILGSAQAANCRPKPEGMGRCGAGSSDALRSSQTPVLRPHSWRVLGPDQPPLRFVHLHLAIALWVASTSVF